MAKKLHNPPLPFLLGKSRSSENPAREEWVISFDLEEEVMIKTWGSVFLAVMSKNEQIQVFDLQMYLSVILTL